MSFGIPDFELYKYYILNLKGLDIEGKLKIFFPPFFMVFFFT